MYVKPSFVFVWLIAEIVSPPPAKVSIFNFLAYLPIVFAISIVL